MRVILCLLASLMFGIGGAEAHYRHHDNYYHQRHYKSTYTVEDNTGDKMKYDRYGNYIPEEKSGKDKSKGEKVVCHKDEDGKIICED